MLVVAWILVFGLQPWGQGIVGQTALPTKVGPSRGTLILASTQTPTILNRFIEEAGGPEALIVFVPTAALQSPGGPQVFVPSNLEAGLKATGASNLVVLHTFDRKVADSAAFIEPIKRASGVWFAGGSPENLLDTYAGTKAEEEFRNVLTRGGVVGGLSAGAMVLASDTVNGSLDADRQWVVRKAFGFLRGVAFQPHAQNPKPESWMLKRPDLILIAADNSTAWVVRGDIAEIIGEGNAYVYRDSTNSPEAPSIALRSDDCYDLAARVVHREKDR